MSSHDTQSKSRMVDSFLFEYRLKNEEEQVQYVEQQPGGETRLIRGSSQFRSDCSYKKVTMEKSKMSQQPDWESDTQQLNKLYGLQSKSESHQRKSKSSNSIKLRRLPYLYEQGFKPEFFHQESVMKKPKIRKFDNFDDNGLISKLLHEVNHLSVGHIKSLFITQGFSASGEYRVVVNEGGEYKVVEVSDHVPVFADTNEHIWGLEEEPWKMILLKVWAMARCGHSQLIKEYEPFKFIEHFTNNNWKYFNLEREGHKFMSKYSGKKSRCHILLQSKNSLEVQRLGLEAGSLGYNLIQFQELSQQNQTRYKVQVRSRFPHKWKGKIGVIHEKTLDRDFTEKSRDPFMLQRNLIMTDHEFLNVFSAAYITSLAQSTFTESHRVVVPKNSRTAVYLQFSIKQSGFLDFSLIQPESNRKKIQTEKSKILHQGRLERFLKCEYILVKSRKGMSKESKLQPGTSVLGRGSHSPSKNQQNQSVIRKMAIGANSKIGKSRQKVEGQRATELINKCKLQAYEFQRLSGYNRGEGHFLYAEPGDYYLRLSSEISPRQAVYNFNYCCHEQLAVHEEIVGEEEDADILEQCMLSLAGTGDRFEENSMLIYFGDNFVQMGYGFAIMFNLATQTQGLISVNAQLLRKEGYEIVGKNKRLLAENGSLAVQPASEGILVLRVSEQSQKKSSDSRRVWPPKAIEFLRALQHKH